MNIHCLLLFVAVPSHAYDFVSQYYEINGLKIQDFCIYLRVWFVGHLLSDSVHLTGLKGYEKGKKKDLSKVLH